MNKTLKKFFSPLLILLILFLIFYYARKTFFTLILSIVFSYLLNPVIKFFEVRGIKRIYTVSTIYILFGAIISILIIVIINLASIDINSFINSWPSYYMKFENFTISFINKIIAFFPILEKFKIEEKILSFISSIPSFVISFIPSLVILFIIPFVSFFILSKGDKIIENIAGNLPSKYVETFYYIISRIDFNLGSYLRGIMSEAFILFTISFFGLFLLNIDYFSIIAAIVGISSLVPYLGAITGATVSSIIAYLQYNNIYAVIKVVLFFISIRFIDDWFLQPYIMKKAVNLNPAIVVLSLMAGGEIAGFWGVIFAVPLTCIIREMLHITLELYRNELRIKEEAQLIKIETPYT